jgi:hypothetical protein
MWTLRSEEIAFRDAAAAGAIIEFSALRFDRRHRFGGVIQEYLGISCSPQAKSIN